MRDDNIYTTNSSFDFNIGLKHVVAKVEHEFDNFNSNIQFGPAHPSEIEQEPTNPWLQV